MPLAAFLLCLQRHDPGSHCHPPVVCAGVCTDTSQSQAAAMSSGGLVSTVQPALKISTGFVPVVFISGLLHHSSSLSVLCSALGTLDDSLSKKPNRA